MTEERGERTEEGGERRGDWREERGEERGKRMRQKRGERSLREDGGVQQRNREIG